MLSLTTQQVRVRRLRGQRLEPRAGRGGLIDTARALIGVNAQNIPAMQLMFHARVNPHFFKGTVVEGAVDTLLKDQSRAKSAP